MTYTMDVLHDRQLTPPDDIQSLQSWSDCIGAGARDRNSKKSVSSLSLTSSDSEHSSNLYPGSPVFATNTQIGVDIAYNKPDGFVRARESFQSNSDNIFGAITACDNCDSNVNRSDATNNDDGYLRFKTSVTQKPYSTTNTSNTNTDTRSNTRHVLKNREDVAAVEEDSIKVANASDSEQMGLPSSCIRNSHSNTNSIDSSNNGCAKPILPSDHSKSRRRHKKHHQSQSQSVLQQFCDQDSINSTSSVEQSLEQSDDKQHNSLVQNVYPLLDGVVNTNETTVTDNIDESILRIGEASSRLSSDPRPTFFKNSYVFKSGYPHNKHISPHNVSGSSSFSRNFPQTYSPSISNSATSSHRLSSDVSTPQFFKQGYTKNTPSSQFRSQQNISTVHKDLRKLPNSTDHLDALRNIEQHRLEPDNVKNKIKSAWNNLKYGWTIKTKSSMKHDEPLYFLGSIYHKRPNEVEEEHAFLKHFSSRLWLTYRSNFYPIPGTRLSTDCGWGCMLRSGQMIVAQCLITHFLGSDWRLHNTQTREEQAYHREIIRWFSDPVDEAPSDKSPFCLHHLTNCGRLHKKEPGEWYGPSSAAFIFRDAFEKATQTLPILSQLCLYVAQDCTVYIDDIMDLCTENSRSENPSSVTGAKVAGSEAASAQEIPRKTWTRSLIILIPMRLGGEVLNDIYVPCVKKLLSQPNCMGIIGGKPKHSLYFLGYQDNQLIYLDPHYCRDAVDTRGKDFKIETYHCMSPRKLLISKMDPSCTVGFYIKNEEDFWSFVDTVKEVASPHKNHASYPMFIFSEGSHKDAHGGFMDSAHLEKGRVKVLHYTTDSRGEKKRAFTQESEDFVLL